MHAFPFPLSIERQFPKEGGFLVKIPTCYERALHSPIERFLSSLPLEERLFEDPNGFTAMPFNWTGYWVIICCVRVQGHYSSKKTKSVIGTDFNPVFPIDAFVDLISKYRAITRQANESASKHPVANQPSFREFVTVTMHEIRRLNLQIKAQAEEVIHSLAKTHENVFANDRIQNIFATSSLISIRLDTYDFQLNPKAFTSESPKIIHIYKKFEKATHCVAVLAQRHKLKIKIIGQTYRIIFGYDLFEVLPFVLIENAIKYSPRDQDIVIRMVPTITRLSLSVESVGPMLFENEQENVFNQNYRGVNAQRVTKGNGIGLHFAKLVCDLHKIDISVRSDPKELFRLNDIPYSVFEVRLSIPTSDDRR